MADNTESHITHPLYAIAITLLLLYTMELYRKNITLQERLEKSVMPRLAALESVTKDLTATESARDKLLEEHKCLMPRLATLESVTKDLTVTASTHGKLLEEHGEDISLAAETAYRAAGLPSTNSPHPMSRFVPFHSSAQYALDEPILNFLRTSPKKTVREILSHLSQDEAAQTEWKLKTFELEITYHDLNSRLYCLLAIRKLKNDNGARPLWSVTNLGKK
jgi:hypothetical protein